MNEMGILLLLSTLCCTLGILVNLYLKRTTMLYLGYLNVILILLWVALLYYFDIPLWTRP